MPYSNKECTHTDTQEDIDVSIRFTTNGYLGKNDHDADTG